jgi:hypothetical protein
MCIPLDGAIQRIDMKSIILEVVDTGRVSAQNLAAPYVTLALNVPDVSKISKNIPNAPSASHLHGYKVLTHLNLFSTCINSRLLDSLAS